MVFLPFSGYAQMIREIFKDCCGSIVYDDGVGGEPLLLRDATLSNKSARHNKTNKRT